MEEDYYYCSSNNKRSGQIPVFGNWDYTNDLPITQYFECARQAGLVRYSSSSGECDPRAPAHHQNSDLYSVDAQKVPPCPASRKTRAREKRCPHVKEQKKGGRICDVTQPPPKQRHVSHDNNKDNNHTNKTKLRSDAVSYPRPRITSKPPKAVDEDLYKIPPELINRKKRLGFISRCLVPACSA